MTRRKTLGAGLIISPVVIIFTVDTFVYGLWITVCTYEFLILMAFLIYRGVQLYQGK